MNAFYAIIEFIYNNLLIVATFVAVLAFLAYYGRQLFEEATINKQLNLKQRTLRSVEGRRFKETFKRRAWIAAVPLVLILLLFIVFWPEEEPSQEITRLTSEADVVSYHETFQERFYDWHFEEVQEVLADMEAVLELRETDPTVHGGLDDVAAYDNHVYTLTDDELHVADLEGTSVSQRVRVDLTENLSGTTLYESVGLHAADGRLLVVGQLYQDIPETAPKSTFFREDRQASVQVFDISEEEPVLEDTYTVTGTLTDIHYDERNVVLATTHYLPFGSDDFRASDHRPYLQTNDDRPLFQRYSDIRYIPGTQPNAFLTFSTINPRSGQVDFQTLLGDWDNSIAMEGADVYLGMDNYQFRDIPEGIRLPDPVRHIDTSMTRLNVVNDRMYRHRTRQLSGIRTLEDAFEVTDDYVAALTDDGQYRLSRMDRNFSRSPEVASVPVEGSIVSWFLHKDTVYLETVLDGDHETRAYDLADENVVETLAPSGEVFGPFTFYDKNRGLVLSAYQDNGNLDIRSYESLSGGLLSRLTRHSTDFDEKGLDLDPEEALQHLVYDENMGELVLPLYELRDDSDSDSPDFLSWPVDGNGVIEEPYTFSTTPGMEPGERFQFHLVEGYRFLITEKGIAALGEEQPEEHVTTIHYRSP